MTATAGAATIMTPNEADASPIKAIVNAVNKILDYVEKN